MHGWEVKAVSEEKINSYDAAIVLTGMASFDPENNRLEFNDRTDRLMQSIKLYNEKKITKIFLCGGSIAGDGNDSINALELKKYLETIGITSEDIIVEFKSHNTHENAVLIKPLLEKYFPGGKFLLITSAFHIRRATACFIKAGIAVFPYSTDRYSGSIKFDIEYLLIPSSETLFNWEKLLHEWVGTVAYSFMGYL